MRQSTGTDTVSLGEIVMASCELGNAVACDSTDGLDLAASHLGRLLARGGNAKLVDALTAMAKELAPVASVPVRRTAGGRSKRMTTMRRPMKRAA